MTLPIYALMNRVRTESDMEMEVVCGVELRFKWFEKLGTVHYRNILKLTHCCLQMIISKTNPTSSKK
jgi:hypothetical protein